MGKFERLIRLVQGLSPDERRVLSDLLSQDSEPTIEIDRSRVRISRELISPYQTEVCPVLERHTGDGTIKINTQKRTYSRAVCEYRVDMDCRIKGGHCPYAL